MVGDDALMELLAIIAIVALSLCVAIWRLAKAGGHVDLGGHISVKWGK